MAELLTPLPTLIGLPQTRLPSCPAWDRLSPHWPVPEDRDTPGQWDAKVQLFHYLAQAWEVISDDSYRALTDERLYRNDTSEPQQSKGLRWEHLAQALPKLGPSLRALRDRTPTSQDIYGRPAVVKPNSLVRLQNTAF
jgi:hypothetical protein